jgi:FAD dependent oxidoreductase
MTSIEDDWVEVSHPEQETFPYPPMLSTKKSLDPGLPRSNPTKSAWQIPPDPLQSYRSTERLPTDILDVVIIGSGLSATSVAWHLLRGDGLSRQMTMKTLMLEARDVCSGATGRNGNFYFVY